MTSSISDEDMALIASIVSDPENPVYFFNDVQPPALIGAAMARVSRSPSDLRHIWLNEFSEDGLSRVGDLIRRVVTEYGDDSVQQLVPVQFAIEGASNWATKVLEWPRIGMAYLEQSTRYIYFDRKDEDGNWPYYTPPNLSAETAGDYRVQMDRIFELYSEVVQGITDYVRTRDADRKTDVSEIVWNNSTRAAACDAARNMLPTATRSTIGFMGNAQSLSNLIIHLRSQSMVEAQQLADELTEQARRLPYLAPFLERVDTPDRGLADAAYRSTNRAAMRELVDRDLGSSSGEIYIDSQVHLVGLEPRDEAEVLAWMMFPYADGHSLGELKSVCKALSSEKVGEVITTYMGERLNRRHKPGRGIERAHFWWEIVDEYATFRDLQRHRIVDAMEWQRLTVKCGYSVPALVVEAGFESQYRKAFLISANLYWQLWDHGAQEEAQYATLLGHKMRYSFGTNLRELFHFIELRTQPAGHAGYRAICQKMYQWVQQHYPRFAAGMVWVNTEGETDDLRRLAAERAAEFKLSQQS